MFGISPQFQSRLGPIGSRLSQPMQPPQPPKPMDLSQAGSLPGSGDLRAGLSKLGFGPSTPAGTNQPGYSSAVMNMGGPVSYMPPSMPPISGYDPAAMTTGLPASAGAGAGAGAGADVAAAGTDAAAASGFDISQILAFLGL